jgi:hypothetical protein
MNDVLELVLKAISELRNEGLEPDILLAGPGFIEYSGNVIKELGIELKVYTIEELGYDAVIADSGFLGQIRRASKRISVEPFLNEDELWGELKKLGV